MRILRPMQSRRSIRIKHYDYATPGAYFVTVVTQGRLPLFGEIVHREMHLNDAGRMVDDALRNLAACFGGVSIDTHIVMPNHIHVIIEIQERVGAGLVPALRGDGQPQGIAPTRTRLPEIVGRFKSTTTLSYIRAIKTHNWLAFHQRLWQRNYHEHVIRNERERDALWEYVAWNPCAWPDDVNNPHL